jgi:hypothetical protein
MPLLMPLTVLPSAGACGVAVGEIKLRVLLTTLLTEGGLGEGTDTAGRA